MNCAISETQRSRVSPLVRVDEEFLAGRTLGEDGEVGGIERLLQRYDFGVMAGEGGLELGDHALPELLAVHRADLHQEREKQPAADTPRRAEGAVDLDGADVEAAIN